MPLPDKLDTLKADAGATPELSVVMPCYNESEGIESVLRAWIAELDASVGPSWEIIVINDGSTDGTARVLDRLRKENRAIRVIHQLNTGHDVAARRGYELARGHLVLQVDSDGRVLPDDFRALWERRHTGSLVLGHRVLPPNRWFQRALLRVLRGMISFLFGVRLEDPASPFRLMRREITLAALHGLPSDFASVNLAIAIRLAQDGVGPVPELPYPVRRRPTGERPGAESPLRRTLAQLGDLVRLRFAAPALSSMPRAADVSAAG